MDFQEFYGLDLADEIYRKGDPMSARRLATLVVGLPTRSRTARLMEPDLWPSEDTLLGLVIERLDTLATITVKAHGGKAKAPPPIVPRPKKQALVRRSKKRAEPVASVLDSLDKALGGVS